MTPEEAVEEVRKRVFRVQAGCAGKVGVGTAFMIARLHPSNRIIVATARHLLEFPVDARVTWCFQCLAEDGSVVGECRFASDESKPEERPYRFYKHADVGFCVLPPQEQVSEGQPVRDDLIPLPVISQGRRLAQGARVAWAGFPLKVEKFLGQPQLCYFEGVVSAFHADGSRGRYVVDGHNARGVSGGPVWHWPDSGTGIEIAGIVAAYGLQESDMPGFCVFEPINPVVAFIRSQYKGQRVDT
ncbi:MAG: trypsin-like peptidase domain-containing protein [Planctomycetes bacterium]|nr:trypsin-like peptidase domain-containing protein [Planctomycetota bacterium]